MDHARAEGGRGQRRALGAAGMHHVEALRAAFIEDGDQIDDDARSAHRGFDRARIAHIGLHGMDLPDAAERLQEIGKLGPAHGDADAVAALGERAHDMAAEEAGAAENGDKGVGVGLKGHEVRTRAAILLFLGGIQDRPCAVQGDEEQARGYGGQIYPAPLGLGKQPTDCGRNCFGSHSTTSGNSTTKPMVTRNTA